MLAGSSAPPARPLGSPHAANWVTGGSCSTDDRRLRQARFELNLSRALEAPERNGGDDKHTLHQPNGEVDGKARANYVGVFAAILAPTHPVFA
jgi:hypothetical protein